MAVNNLSGIKINNKKIGVGEPTYIIAEIGICHNGKVETAKKLIDAAHRAGADAVKFQKRHLPSLYSQDILENSTNYEQSFQYIIPILKETELSYSNHVELQNYAEDKGLEYICTPFDIESAKFLHEELGVNAFKVASCDLTNYDLLEYICDTFTTMLVSTGMSSWSEIERTAYSLKEKNANFALLHCRSAYPVWPREVNLKMISRLKQFGVPVGYSGHDIGTAISLVAASMGACIIEKHITLDKKARGPDHKISLLPRELKVLVRDIRIADQAMQDNDRFLLRGEILNRDVFRFKGKYATKETPVLAKPIGKWGLIARPTDLEAVMKFNPRVVEIRFTENDFKHKIKPKQYNSSLVVHAPEYLQDKLFDLCSGDPKIWRASVDMAQKTIDRAVFLKDYFLGKPKVILHPGAMAMSAELRVDRLRDRLEYAMARINGDCVEILLENLPSYAWYWGGMWKTNYFMAPDEIESFCRMNGVGLCLDICHAFLYCNAFETNLCDFVEIVKPHIRHMHIGDGYGMDGEGVQIGGGDIDWKKILPLLDLENISYVPEIWRGHHNNFAGFIEALNKISKIA